ncbi:uncharacterized protein LOC115005686 [Cottoperca gobio]|uniref:Uncharacterized protein LOC115005686 n=1 Tax=Cottoperca gobio TaxID=56716 RepID=A0A6J2PDL5_COTGO|nr:uncharacterized protein LOC115005686 [Cottoperca gobio]
MTSSSSKHHPAQSTFTPSLKTTLKKKQERCNGSNGNRNEVPEKGERLKVVRPPLALDRTYCIALKDDCSFALLEVGELRSAMNLYLFAASTSERCSTWVSTIHQAKESLRSLRQTESNRQLENWKLQLLENKPAAETKTDDLETEEQLLTKSRRETFVDEITEELIISREINGMLASKESEEQPPEDEATDPDVSFLPNNHKRPFVKKGSAVWQQAVREYEWIEMEVRREEVRMHAEQEQRKMHSLMTTRQQLIWNQKTQSAPNLDRFSRSAAADPNNTTGPHDVLYPDVDYPMDEESASQLPHQPTISWEGPEVPRLPGEGGISTKRDSDSQSVHQDSRRNSSSQSGDTDTSPEAWGCSKSLKSPGLHRRRPTSTHHGPFTQTPGQSFQGVERTHSDSFSDSNTNRKRNSLPSAADSHRVLKLGSLKPHQGMFCNVHDRVSPDPQTLSESELPDHNFYNRVKTQRSASIPNMIIEIGHGLPVHSSSMSTLPRTEDAPSSISRPNPNGHYSPLEGLLERAKVRDGFKKGRHVKKANLRSRHPPPSPSFSTTPSPSPSAQ